MGVFNLTVFFPSLKEQTAIAEILSDMDAEIDSLAAKLNKLPNIKLYYAPSIIESDDISAPYFFVLHEDMTIGELFIPDKSYPKQTNIYLEKISERYYNTL